MTLVKDINSKDWSISSTKNGLVVVGVNDLKQCVFNILMTRKGSDPLRPTFGCGIFKYLDKPVNRVLPSMMRAVQEAIEEFEPRVTITKIKATIDVSLITIDVDMEATIGDFSLRLNIGIDPNEVNAVPANRIIVSSGFYWITENGEYVVWQ